MRGLTGALAIGSVGMRVAASGNRPAGASLTNATAFTGEATTTPPTTTKLVAPVLDTPTMSATKAKLTNFPVPNASGYRYQAATDAAFTQGGGDSQRD